MPDQPIILLDETKPRLSKKKILPFLAGLLVIVLSLQVMVYLSQARSAQGEILGAATSAYDDLNSAGSNLTTQNFGTAQVKFADARNSLLSAQEKLDQFRPLTLLVPQANSANHVLSGASLLAQAGGKLTDALNIFDNLKISKSGVGGSNLLSEIGQNQDSLNQSLALLKQASAEFDKASNLPGDYAQTLQNAKDQVALLTSTLDDLVNLEGIYTGMFGNGPKVYLLVFQNYDEMRATGGFIGTYGVIKIDGGHISDLKVDSIYDLDGHIYDMVAAPGPFQPDIKKWGIRDANWFADFPTSAKKLLQFFESGSQTADGVIALTPAMFGDILNLTGPIALPKYNVTITADNFQQVVQYKTSVDYDHATTNPKQMLSDLAPILLDKLSGLDKKGMLSLLQIMQDNLNQKQVMLYSKDEKMERRISDLKMAGSILPADGDYLDIVNTNLGGTKTDLSVTQGASLHAKILSDGSVFDTLTITRKNQALQKNRDFLRVLVPQGATLVSAAGLDDNPNFVPSEAEGFSQDPDLAAWDQGTRMGDVFVRSESGKTEFSGWVSLDPATARTITITYMLPFRVSGLFALSASYSLLFQKQDGVRPYEFSADLDCGSRSVKWVSADALADGGKINFNYTSNSDQYWAAILGN